jgi:hypothetical protein
VIVPSQIVECVASYRVQKNYLNEILNKNNPIKPITNLIYVNKNIFIGNAKTDNAGSGCAPIKL